VVSLGIFPVVPPTEPCALRSTQSLKVSTRDFYWGEGGRCVWLTTYHPCSAKTSRKSGVLIYPKSLGILWLVAGEFYSTSASHTYLRSDFYMFMPIVGMCGAPFVIELSHMWKLNSNDCENWKATFLSSGLFG